MLKVLYGTTDANKEPYLVCQMAGKLGQCRETVICRGYNRWGETKTNLLREVFGAQEESQQASDNHGQD